jgi:hypothetical protein
MRSISRLAAGLAAAVFVLAVASTSSPASTPCERRQGWEKNFAYIDTISATCQILTTAAEVGATAFVPYQSIVAGLGQGLAGTVLNYAAAYGVNLQQVVFDKHHICRIIRAGNALSTQPNRRVRLRLLQYGLCPPTDDACKTRVKAEIFERYGLINACAQT